MIRKLVKKIKIMAWFLCALNVFLHVQNLWYLHPNFSSEDNPSATWIFFGRIKYLTFLIILYHLFYQHSQFKINYLYLGPKLFSFWLHLLVVNHYRFKKMMMWSFLGYEIRGHSENTNNRVYVKFIFKYFPELFTAILIN